jgi:hypothetical protein
LPLLLCAAGIAAGLIRMLDRYWQILLWFLLSIAFCFFLPVWFQRKFLFGAHVPLCILAAISIDLILARCFAPGRRRWAVAAGAVLLLPVLTASPIHMLFVHHPEEMKENTDQTYYISGDYLEAFRYLKENSRPGDIVFADLSSSRLIPALAGNTVLWGHWAMSIDFSERKEWWAGLFDPHSDWDDGRRGGTFWGAGMRFIFADAALKQMIEHNPRAWRVILADADRVFTNRSVAVFRRRSAQTN